MSIKHYFHLNCFYKVVVPIVVGTVLFLTLRVYSCGGGVVPYVPTQSGATGGASTGQFFLMEKGIAIDMFDVKKLQPLFRNIILSGNERKERKTMEALGKEDSKIESTQAESDSVSVTQDESSSEKEPTPVLNIHRLH